MLRFISLVAVRPGTDIGSILKAGTTMCAEDPEIISGIVSPGLALMRDIGAPEADYSLVLDFADADAMNRWASGERHGAFNRVVGDCVESFKVIQFTI